MLDDIPEGHDDYEIGLTKLWGEDTLKQLRHYVNVGDIEDHHIRTMADRIGMRRIYNGALRRFLGGIQQRRLQTEEQHRGQCVHLECIHENKCRGFLNRLLYIPPNLDEAWMTPG